MSTITHQAFGHSHDGSPASLYTIKNGHDLEARITNYGATIVSLIAPDRDGKPGEITLGFDSLEGYLGNHPFFGCVAGRYANRIGSGAFALNEKKYQLAQNNNGNHLHGGNVGFNRKLWDGAIAGDSVMLTMTSPDGDEGYPGTLTVTLAYSLTDQNDLSLRYRVTCDADTVHNITNHTYFNLDGSPTILDHELMINANAFTPTDAGLIPTGEIRPVDGTPLDFRTAMRIGDRIDADYEPIQFAGGYDHNWIINGRSGELNLAARATSLKSGRVLECFTDQPAVQFYAGNMIAPGLISRNGEVAQRGGFCLETQHYPDSPNQPGFPSTVLRAGEVFESTTVYRMSVR